MPVKINAPSGWKSIYAGSPDIVKAKMPDDTWKSIVGTTNPDVNTPKKFIKTTYSVWQSLDYFDATGDPGGTTSKISLAGEEHVISNENKTKVINVGAEFADRYLVILTSYRTNFNWNTENDLDIKIDGVPVVFEDRRYVSVSHERSNNADIQQVGMGVAVLPLPTGTSITLGMVLGAGYRDAKTLLYIVDSGGVPYGASNVTAQVLKVEPEWSPVTSAAATNGGVSFTFIGELSGERFIKDSDVTWTQTLMPNQKPTESGYFILSGGNGMDVGFKDLTNNVLVYSTQENIAVENFQIQWGYLRYTKTDDTGKEVYDYFANDGAGLITQINFFNP